MKVVKLMDR